MNLLITGGCGFIGSNFINQYFWDDNINVLINLDAMYYCANEQNVHINIRESSKYNLIKGNVCDADLMDYILNKYNITHVIHFAAQSHVQNSFNDSKQYTKDNVVGTHTLLECCRLYGKIEKFIHVSTDEVYGESMLGTNETQKTEQSVLCPSNPYAATKAAAELIAQSYYHSFKMPIVITRGNNVYGPNQYPEKLIPRFIELLNNDQKVTIQGDGSNVRAFLHVDDTINAFKCILEKGEIGEIYNIGCDDNMEYSVLDIAKMLIKLIKHTDDYEGWIEYVADRPFNDKRYYISNEKVKNLGWKINVNFEDGLKDLVLKDILNKLFDNDIYNTYYSETFGFNKNVCIYRKFTHLYAKVFFNILDKLKLDYYVFAGTSIGYIRDKCNIPWVDDYDIIIFEDEFENFEKNVIPKLNDLGFWCFKPTFTDKTVGWHILSKFDQKCFQCDVFFTKINNDGIIKNCGEWGMYRIKNINIDIVKPKRYLTIEDDLTLPFFNDLYKDIEIEYGDVINECVFHIDHSPCYKIKEHFLKVYKEFNNIKDIIINNLKIEFKNHNYETNKTLYNYNDYLKNPCKYNHIENNIHFLRYIKNNNIKNLYIFDEKLLIFIPDVKFYFPNINVAFYMINEIECKNVILLNYVDKLFFSKKETINSFVERYDLVLLNKPIIDYIRVITFGTYDLFHIGHTNILKRAKEYGEELYVGVSTDELNKTKAKISCYNLEKRKYDVFNSSYTNVIFDEESLDNKNIYVEKYNCNLLIMGDDWKDAFNWCNCACLYLERTPGISTTMLKNMNK